MSEHRVTVLPAPTQEEHDAMTVGEMKRLLQKSGGEKLFLVEGGDLPLMTLVVRGSSNVLAVLQALHHHDLIDAEQIGRLWNAQPETMRA